MKKIPSREPPLATRLLAWFKTARRPMPWRLNPSPYGAWISEIMMQQTTYEQALPFYRRFMKRFPSVEKLAAAGEQNVLKAWEGLGYYARARNLLKAARIVAASKWPSSNAEWLALPGVGPYTAAALASVLNGERIPVVDGNVARVFARVWRLEDDFKDPRARAALADRLAAQLPDDPGTFNQAMMELGALICHPRSPNCGACPLATLCAAYRAHEQEAFPRRAKKAERPVRKRTFVVVTDDRQRVLLVQNREGALLKGLWELPSVEPSADYRQAFTHFTLEASVWRTAPDATPRFLDPKSVPLTTATRRILGLA